MQSRRGREGEPADGWPRIYLILPFLTILTSLFGARLNTESRLRVTVQSTDNGQELHISLATTRYDRIALVGGDRRIQDEIKRARASTLVAERGFLLVDTGADTRAKNSPGKSLPHAVVLGHAIRSAGFLRVGGALLWSMQDDPLPRPVVGRRDLRTVISCEGRTTELEWSDTDCFAVCGVVRNVVRLCGGRVTLIGLQDEDAPLVRCAAEAVERMDRAVRAAGEAYTFENLKIVVTGSPIPRREQRLAPLLLNPLSNLLAGPYAKDSSVLRLQAATQLVCSRLKSSHKVEGFRQCAALGIAIADLALANCDGYSSPLVGNRAADRALQAFSRFGPRALQDGVVSDDPVREYVLAAEVLAPIVREQLAGLNDNSGTRHPPPRGRPASPERRIDIGALVRLPCAVLQSMCTAQDPLSCVRERLAASSAIRESSETPAVPDAHRLSIAADFFGFLEDCGCKSSSSGGVSSVLYYWSSPATTQNIKLTLGNIVADEEREQCDDEVSALIVRLVGEVPGVVQVPGTEELLRLSRGGSCATALETAGLVACNVVRRVGDGTLFRPYADVVVGGHPPLRIIGVVGETQRLVRLRHRELIDEAFEILNPASSVARVLGTTPPEYDVVVAGTIHPADVSAIAGLGHPRMLIVSTEADVPRVTDGKPRGYQNDGMVHCVPVVFARAANYGVTEVGWLPESGHASARTIFLKDRLGPDDPIGRRVTTALEGIESNVETMVPADEPLLRRGFGYVGSGRCELCHAEYYRDWAGTPHATAMNTLRHVQRHRVRACVSCHVVGFERAGGYTLRQGQVDLENIGCENCHGPGSGHVERPQDISVVRRRPDLSLCASCHTPKRSDMFVGDPMVYWHRVSHVEVLKESRASIAGGR